MKPKDVNSLLDQGVFSNLDIHFARFCADLGNDDSPELFLAAALVSRSRTQGHVCLDLKQISGSPLLEKEDQPPAIICPDLKGWKKVLEKSRVVGRPGQYKPLILDDRSRLYLHRYWDYQHCLAESLIHRIKAEIRDIDIGLLKEGLDRMFPGNIVNDVDWQKIAAITALKKNFCVISGGPGTGKTTTVAGIITLMLEQGKGTPVRIALAAPTGKAASRLQDSVREAVAKLNCDEDIRAQIPREASTIHRLLGTIPESPYFRHNAETPLPVDALIVDEASMVDLALMSKLVQALPSEARLILLGDKDQLASVEAGAVLGDLCDAGKTHGFSQDFSRELVQIDSDAGRIEAEPDAATGIRDCIVELQKSYRFGSRSGIGAVSRSVNAGEDQRSLILLKNGQYSDIGWRDLPDQDSLLSKIESRIVAGYESYLKADNPSEALARFGRFRILCAIKTGPFGVAAVNRAAEQVLEQAGLIHPKKIWYAGRPVLITQNDYQLRLFNGDVGICLSDTKADGELRVFFPWTDNGVRKLHPLRLPAHETVYAMTVHRSQGSEFDTALFILPNKNVPVLTRELIYTAITRARKRLDVWAEESVFREAVLRRTQRSSGLRDILWESGIRQSKTAFRQ